MKPVERKSFWFWVGDFCDKQVWANDITPEDIAIDLPGTTTFPEVLVLAGVFTSKTEARKNGWGGNTIATFKAWSQDWRVFVPDRPGLIIPEGFTFFHAGKGKTIQIVVVKNTHPWIDPISVDDPNY